MKKIDSPDEYRIDQQVKIGRVSDNDIVITSGGVSRYHCLIYVEDGNIMVKDLGSTNGTYINDQKITRAQVYKDDILRVGLEKFVFLDSADPEMPGKDKEPDSEGTSILPELAFGEKIKDIIIKPLNDRCSRQYLLPVNTISKIGRLESNHIFLDDSSVSRTHATIEVQEYRVVLSDLSSANGTFVNDKKIRKRYLQDGDTISIADFRFVVIFEMNPQEILPEQKWENYIMSTGKI